MTTYHPIKTVYSICVLLLLVLTGCQRDVVLDDASRAALASATAAGNLPPSILGAGKSLRGASIAYLPGDTATVGYLSVPEGDGPFPALIIIHEWNGLVDRVRQVADDLAAQGYVTLAVDLYEGRVGSNPMTNIMLVQETQADMPKVINNLNTAVQHLKTREDVTGRVGIINKLANQTFCNWCFN